MSHHLSQSSHPLSPPRAHFGFRFVVLARRWRQELDARLAAVGLTDATWAPLIHLGEARGGLSQKELAARAGVDASTLVRLIDRLEAHGFVERTAHRSDRRAKLVSVTQAGRKALVRIREVLAQAEAEMLGCLSDVELAQMLDGFDKIDGRLRSLQNDRGPAA
jgi:MarR family transcriptional regulator, transcriptional regulator for hemolysin